MKIIKRESTHILTIESALDENNFLIEVNLYCKEKNYKFQEILDSDENENGNPYYVVLVEELKN
jgi:hypothetical protein